MSWDSNPSPSTSFTPAWITTFKGVNDAEYTEIWFLHITHSSPLLAWQLAKPQLCWRCNAWELLSLDIVICSIMSWLVGLQPCNCAKKSNGNDLSHLFFSGGIVLLQIFLKGLRKSEFVKEQRHWQRFKVGCSDQRLLWRNMGVSTEKNKHTSYIWNIWKDIKNPQNWSI